MKSDIYISIETYLLPPRSFARSLSLSLSSSVAFSFFLARSLCLACSLSLSVSCLLFLMGTVALYRVCSTGLR